MVIESTSKIASFTEEYHLSMYGEGNYRAKIEMKFYDTDGSFEEIELDREVVYSRAE